MESIEEFIERLIARDREILAGVMIKMREITGDVLLNGVDTIFERREMQSIERRSQEMENVMRRGRYLTTINTRNAYYKSSGELYARRMEERINEKRELARLIGC